MATSNLPIQPIWSLVHTWELFLGDLEAEVNTRTATRNKCLYSDFQTQEEQKRVEDALSDPDWVIFMQGELN